MLQNQRNLSLLQGGITFSGQEVVVNGVNPLGVTGIFQFVSQEILEVLLNQFHVQFFILFHHEHVLRDVFAHVLESMFMEACFDQFLEVGLDQEVD